MGTVSLLPIGMIFISIIAFKSNKTLDIIKTNTYMHLKNVWLSLPCPQVPRAGWPVIYRQDVKVLL